jgi:hypothetical protein
MPVDYTLCLGDFHIAPRRVPGLIAKLLRTPTLGVGVRTPI